LRGPRTRRAASRWLKGAAYLALAAPVGASAAQDGTEPAGTPPPPAIPGPAAALDRAVSLQEAITIGLQNHARIAVAEENVQASKQRVRQVRTGTLPEVIASVGYRGSGTTNLGGIFGSEPTQTVPGAGGAPVRRRVDIDQAQFDQGIQPQVAINYNIFNGGLTRAQVRQARAGVETSVAGLSATRNDHSFQITSDYLSQLRSQRVYELRIVEERLAEEQLARVQARIRAGSAAEADAALALSQLRNRQVDRIEAQNTVRITANNLRNSMGLSVGPPLTLVELQQEERALPTLEALREMARQQRPEVVQSEAQVRSAEQGVSIARISRKPRLDTTFAFGVNPNNPFQRGTFSVGAAVSLPLWDAGLTHAREQEARTSVQSNAALLEQAKKDVAAEVEEAYLNLINARERTTASRLAVDASQVNLEQTTRRYELGVGGTSVVDLIEAQVQFATANNNLIQALYDRHLAEAQLNRAIGR
jgi:outer membrane protein